MAEKLRALQRANAAMRSELASMQKRLEDAGVTALDPSAFSLEELCAEIDEAVRALRALGEGGAGPLGGSAADEDAEREQEQERLGDRLSRLMQARAEHPDFIAEQRAERLAFFEARAEAAAAAFEAFMAEWRDVDAARRPRLKASNPVIGLLELFARQGAEAVSKLHPADFKQYSCKNLGERELLALLHVLPRDGFLTDDAAATKTAFRDGVVQALRDRRFGRGVQLRKPEPKPPRPTPAEGPSPPRGAAPAIAPPRLLVANLAQALRSRRESAGG